MKLLEPESARTRYTPVGRSLTSSIVSESIFAQPRPAQWLRAQGMDETELFAFGSFLQPSFDSFPSGHAMAAFSLYGFCALVSKKAWVQGVFLVLGILIAFSRIYLGFHFLQDVVAGSIIGILIALVGYTLQARLLKGKAWAERGLVSRPILSES